MIIIHFLPLTIPCNVALSFPNMGVTITLSAFDNKHLLLYHFTFQSGLQWPIRYGMPSVKIETICDITVFRRLRLNPWHSNSVSSPRLRIALSIFLLQLATAFRIFERLTTSVFVSFLNCKSLFPKQFNGPATEICRPLLQYVYISGQYDILDSSSIKCMIIFFVFDPKFNVTVDFVGYICKNNHLRLNEKSMRNRTTLYSCLQGNNLLAKDS